MLAVNIRGLNELNQYLDGLPRNLENKLKVVIRESCVVDIETQAKLKLTRDRHVDTGRLRASIHTEYEGSGRVLPGRITGPLSAIVGTNVEYAKYVERIDSYMGWAAKHGIPLLKQRVIDTVREVTNG